MKRMAGAGLSGIAGACTDLRPEAASSGSRPRWREQWRGCFLQQRISASLDNLYAARTRQAALETRPSGVPSRWHNPSTGNAGAIAPDPHLQIGRLNLLKGIPTHRDPRRRRPGKPTATPAASPTASGGYRTDPALARGGLLDAREGRRSIQPSLHGPTAPVHPVPIRHQRARA